MSGGREALREMASLTEVLYARTNDSLVGRFRKIFQNAENSAAFPH